MSGQYAPYVSQWLPEGEWEAKACQATTKSGDPCGGVYYKPDEKFCWVHRYTPEQKAERKREAALLRAATYPAGHQSFRAGDYGWVCECGKGGSVTQKPFFRGGVRRAAMILWRWEAHVARFR